MYYGPVKAGAWIRAFRRERLPKELDVAVAVPFVSLAAVRSSLGRASTPAIAAQNAFWAREGAYTGEVSPEMLLEFGTAYCLVGHSERRKYLGESNKMAAKKAKAVQAAGISPVICVGETAAERKRGEAAKVVRDQVREAVEDLKIDGRAPLVIAYEPVWSIGTGQPCSPRQAKEMHDIIHEVIFKKFNAKCGEVRVIYGGSVEPRNISEYLNTVGIDGALVGGASLDPRGFGLLCRSAASV